MKTGRSGVKTPGALPLGRPVLAFALLAAVMGPSCKGNVNDDSVSSIDIRFMSISSGGQPGDNGAGEPRVSADGRFVVFSSQSTNLDPRDSNTIEDIFVRDTVSNVTVLVSVNTAGNGGGNDFSGDPVISPDGRFVAWHSRATNFVTGITDTNNREDLFVRDMLNGVTTVASVDTTQTATPQSGVDFDKAAVIADATDVYVAFSSFSNDIVSGISGEQIYLRKIPIATFTTISSGTTVLVSRNTAGTAGGNSSSQRPALGQDATNVYAAWQSFATDLHALDTSGVEDIFYRSVNKSTSALGATVLVSINPAGTDEGDAASRIPDISTDGRFVVFQSNATNLLAAGVDTNGQTDIFVRGDLVSGPVATTRVSVSSGGGQATDQSENPAISPGGQIVVFESDASDLVPGDTNGARDIFIHDRTSGLTTRVSLTLFGGQTNQDSFGPDVSANLEVVFEASGNIIPGPLTFEQQVYRRRM